jgi:hypothetical protein
MATLPHLKPVHGIKNKALYANLTLVRPPETKGAAERKAAAATEAQAQARLKNVVERTNGVLDRLELRQSSLAAEIKRLTKQKNATAARIERIEDKALTLMHEAGLTQVAGIRCNFRAQQAAAALEVTDETKIPAEYLRQPKTPPPEPDKVAIKKALAEDDEIDPAAWGCRLTSRTSLIRK